MRPRASSQIQAVEMARFALGGQDISIRKSSRLVMASDAKRDFWSGFVVLWFELGNQGLTLQKNGSLEKWDARGNGCQGGLWFGWLSHCDSTLRG